MKIKYLLLLIIAANTKIYAQKKQEIKFSFTDKIQINLNCSTYKNQMEHETKIQVTKDSDEFYISLTNNIEDSDKTFLASIMAIKKAINPEALETINDLCDLEADEDADEDIIEKAKGFKINYILNKQKRATKRKKRSASTTELSRKVRIEFTNKNISETINPNHYQNPKITIRVNTMMIIDEYRLLLNNAIAKLKAITNHEEIYHILMTAIYAQNPKKTFLKEDIQDLFWEKSAKYDAKHHDLYKDIEQLVHLNIIDSYAIKIKNKEGRTIHINKLQDK